MQSQAKEVSDYLTEAPAKRLEALTQLRVLCVETLDGYEESMVISEKEYTKATGSKIA